MKRACCFLFSAAVPVLAGGSPIAAADLPPAVTRVVDFVREIKPIFEGKCTSCHGAQKRSGEYRLDMRDLALGEGGSGVAIIPKKGSHSPLLINAARIGDEPMPPDGKGDPVTLAELAVLRAWIDQGALWPDGVVLVSRAAAGPPGATSAVALPAPVARKIDFLADVKPIFDAACLGCHGPARQEAALRLDSKSIAMRGSDSGPIFVPGKSDQSALIHLVADPDPARGMPRKGPRLSPEQIGVLRAWIDQGALWPDGLEPKGVLSKLDHWAFRAPERLAVPPVPRAARPGWARNPIDHFISEGLTKTGLRPSAEADRVTLCRRLYLDLLGLPPSPAEVAAFVTDVRPGAWERLVDRLLSSPHYGERWGRHWLDAARYADTNGFEKDAQRSIWPYRDWVIKAFNQDKPFDQFTIEQLAGDLLPNATLDQRVATGYLRNSMLNEEGGVDPEQFRIEGLIDRVDAIGKTWLGLTINCVQCHTHKFDPIAHREYYRFFAFLNNDSEDELEVVTPDVERGRVAISRRVDRLTDERLVAEVTRLAAWETRMKATQTRFVPLDDSSIYGSVGLKFENLPDNSYAARGDRYLLGHYVVSAKTKKMGISGLQVELLTDSTLPRRGPGRDSEGVAALTEITMEAAPAGAPDAALQKIPFVRAEADWEKKGFEASRAIDGNSQTAWSSDRGPGQRNQDRRLVFTTAKPFGFAGGTRLVVSLSQKAGQRKTIGRFRLSITSDIHPVVDPLSTAARAVLGIPAGKRSPQQRRALFSSYRTGDEEFNKLYNEWPYGPTTLAVSARPWPRQTHVFKRGDWRKPLEVVEPGTPAALHAFAEDLPKNRLGLARWLVDAKNPLTARVIVNRIWAQYFGQGMVATPEDLGTRADPASHPELLDWLATEFRDSGWSWKKVHRLIVGSATYRQSSRLSPALQDKDPYNRWLARAPRLRVEAELVRDLALAAGGLLSPRVGGPSVFPPIPEGAMSLSYGSPMAWNTSTGEDRYRRGLYTFWKRSVPYPSLMVFDNPAGDFSCVRRIRSNTPLQALTTLNDSVFHEAAQAMALRIWKEGGKNDRSRLNYGFRLVTARAPTATELATLLRLLGQQRQQIKNDTARAVMVAAASPDHLPEGVNLHEVAPLALVARVLLNLDETITRE